MRSDLTIDTLGPEGPWCPWCQAPVTEEGDFCTHHCWLYWHWETYSRDAYTCIEGNYKDLTLQPWYGRVFWDG